MHSTRLSHGLLGALSIATVTQAAWYNLNMFPRSGHDLEARQLLSTILSLPTVGATPSASTSVQPTTSNTPTPGPTTSDTPTTPGSTTTPPSTAPPSTPPTKPPTSPTPTPTSGGSSPAGTPSTTTSNGAPATTEMTTAPPSLQTTVVVVTTTDANGQMTQVSSSATITKSGSLADSTSSAQPGITQGTKNTIIGVSVGVGGAIILAVIGLLVWRLRARRRDQEDSEDLVNYGAGTSQFNNSGPAEKSEASGSANGRSPFQSTLESYHAPTQTNAASNF